MSNTNTNFIVGVNIPNRHNDIVSLLHDARSDGYDFITTDLPYESSQPKTDITVFESKWWRTSIVGIISSPPTQSEKNMSSSNDNNECGSNDKGLVDNMISLSGDNKVTWSRRRREAERHLIFMLEWAAHMNIPAVILPHLPTHDFIHYAQFLSTQVLKSSSNNIHLWIRLNFNKKSIENFIILHRLCDGAANLGCILIFKEQPGKNCQINQSIHLLHQLVGCNLRAVMFNTQIFLSNKRGYPTLPKSIQIIFIELLKRLGRTCRVLVEGRGLHKVTEDVNVVGRSGLLLYLEYLKFLRSREEVSNLLDSDEATMELDYLDQLQSALQPLGDNLEFSTYEAFEKDPVKYEKYHQAIVLALQDKVKLEQLRAEEAYNENLNHTILHCVIVVVGAGRGPLVTASLKAVDTINSQAKRNLGRQSSFVVIHPKIIAIEKNPSAVLFLHSLKKRVIEWSETVEIVQCDMRVADREPMLSKMITGCDSRKADIVISELLGSFGDNELSPECLDGVQSSGIMKESCICIPQKYTSYLAPVMSTRLHSEAQAQAYIPSNALEGPSGRPSGSLRAMETPYVTRAHAASQIHRELSCWEFSHPIRKDNVKLKNSVDCIDNDRHAQLLFRMKEEGGVGFGSGYGSARPSLSVLSESVNTPFTANSNIIHGLLGSFSCELYRSISSESSTISIAPSSFSTGMFSWFPLYFPLREPLFVAPGMNVRANMWRKSDINRVWYEWCVEVITSEEDQVVCVSNIHNPNGRSSFVRL